MRVLFVSSGNTVFGISPITQSQGESIKHSGIELSYFPIVGRGFLNYVKSIWHLNRHLVVNKYDIIHAHYSLTAFIVALAGANPIVVSLMGSDAKNSTLVKVVIKIFNRLFWKHIIVKSEEMFNNLGIPSVSVIPNGVDTKKFIQMDRRECQKKLNWDLTKKHILFAAKPSRPEKNYTLAKEMFLLLDNDNFILHTLIDVLPAKMPVWLNAADAVFLTSLWEGSPNVIKEAMACNRPIVATDVGDIRWLFGETKGCYISAFNATDLKDKIEEAVLLNKTNTRERIAELELDSSTIARKIINLYSLVLQGVKE